MANEYFDFYDRYNDWADDDDPSDDFKFWVMVWLYRLQDDPTVSAALAEGLGPPWWFARIPNAEDEHRAVVCLYSLDGAVVRCSGFTTLSKPI